MSEIEALQGIDTLLFARKLSEASKTDGMLIPYQTSLKLSPKRKSDTTKTKSGTVAVSGGLETELEAEFVANWAKIADQLDDSIFNNEVMEFWIVFRKRVNADNKFYAYYMRGYVTENPLEGKADDAATRNPTITVIDTPQRGWTSLPNEMGAQIAYVFRGVGKIEGAAKNDGTDGNGKAWNKDTDPGTGSGLASAASSVASPASPSSDTHQ